MYGNMVWYGDLMANAPAPPPDMSKPWEGNRQRRRRRLAIELNESGRWLARPIETDPIPETPGVYLSDTLYADSRFTDAGEAAVALWTRSLFHPRRQVINGYAAIPVDVAATLRKDSDAELSLIDCGLWSYDAAADCYLFADPGRIYTVVGREPSESAPKRGR
jgi:hypothetical protein